MNLAADKERYAHAHALKRALRIAGSALLLLVALSAIAHSAAHDSLIEFEEAVIARMPWLLPALLVVSLLFAAALVTQQLRRQRKVREQVEAQTQVLRRLSEEWQLAKERAARESAAKSDFLANMSHEIRTPLNSMIGTTELLLGTELNAHQKAQAHTILESAESLLGIINDILDFSKIESGKLSLEHIPFDLGALVEDVAHLFAARTISRHERVEMVAHYPSAIPTHYFGDPVRVRQIISNLVGNAVKFTHRGHVLLAVQRLENGTVRLRVEDTGIGIPEEKRQLIFEKFSQAEGSTARHFGGSGLGLAICSQLVELMKGRIYVESELHKGSTFFVELPLEAMASSYTTALPAPYAGKRALVVDSTVPAAESLRHYLVGLGIRTFICDDEAGVVHALNRAQSEGMSLDYIFVDYMLPGSNKGPATVKHIMGHLLPSSARIIGMAALSNRHIVMSFAGAGCHAFIEKPIRRLALRNVLDGLRAEDGTFVSSVEFGAAAETAPAYADYHGKRVLLVEDNRVNRNLALEMLAKFHIDAESAENGCEAVEMATRNRYDLILMDCQMPEMDGFEASRHLQRRYRDGEVPFTPIIALTANAMKGDRERCLEAGMNDYLCKPLRMQDMQSMLKLWLERQQQEAA